MLPRLNLWASAQATLVVAMLVGVDFGLYEAIRHMLRWARLNARKLYDESADTRQKI